MKESLLYIIHIHESLQKILAYTRDGRDAFMADPKTQDRRIQRHPDPCLRPGGHG